MPQKRIVGVRKLVELFPDVFTSENAVRLRIHKRKIPHFKLPASNRILFDLDIVEEFLLSQRVGTSDELRAAAVVK